MTTGSPKRRRRRRRSHRTLRLVTLIIAGLSLLMGLAMLVWARVEGSATGRLVGCVYLAASAVSLVVYGLAAHRFPFEFRARTAPEALLKDSAGARDGMALLMVLLLMALLSGALLHGLVQTRQRLSLAEWRQERELLRAAAVDAALTTLRDGALGRPLPTKAHAETRLPSDIVTRTLMRPVDRSALPGGLHRAEVPVFGDCFSLDTEASRGSRSRTVRALVCRAPDSSLRVLGWVEAL